MPKMILAPVKSSRTTTCLNVDRDEWEVFVRLMNERGRSASDGVRELVRQTVEAERANA